MRRLTLAITASAAAVLFATAADARPGIGGASHRVGGEASAKSTDGASLIEAVATFLGFSVTAKAAPTVGTDAPRSAAPRTEQCEQEKKRAEAAKASETRRTAQADKRQRGGEPVYLAF